MAAPQMRDDAGVHFSVERSPSGCYNVRLRGHDVPVSKHDTEEEAQDWIARHARPEAPPARPAYRPHFIGLDDGTQLILRAARPDDAEAARDAILVAVHPASGEIVGAVRESGPWVAPAWASRGLEPLLRHNA